MLHDLSISRESVSLCLEQFVTDVQQQLDLFEQEPSAELLAGMDGFRCGLFLAMWLCRSPCQLTECSRYTMNAISFHVASHCLLLLGTLLCVKLSVTPGSRWEHYGKLVQLAHELGNVTVHAGFPRRADAVSAMVKQGEAAGVQLAVSTGALREADHYIAGSDEHYAYFESLISERPMSVPPTGEYRHIFAAQCLKDSVMAAVVHTRLAAGDAVLCVTGQGHSDYSFGVPEQVLELSGRNGTALGEGDVCTITCMNHGEDAGEVLVSGKPVADLVLMYGDKQENKL